LTTVRKLGLEDILDQRAYDRERPALQEEVFRVKRLRRVPLGPIMTLVFENVLTVRWQIQEMARVERLVTDEQILEELKVYNPLIPDPGELSATLFLELTDDAALREWLPKLVGIERAILLGLVPPSASGGADPGGELTWVRCSPEEAHAEQLTRDAVTASVHYIRFELTAEQVEMFSAGPVVLASDHPLYKVEVVIPEATRNELISDLRT
jgi:hypothetical protein